MSEPHPTLKKAFYIEALFNFLSFPFLTSTPLVLSYLLKNPASQINPSTILFTRLFGGLVVGVFTPLLIFGLRTPETRKIVYMSLGMGEGLLIPLLVGEALKKESGKAISSAVAWGAVGCLVPPCFWRVYCLGLRKDLFRDVRVERNGKSL
jgi:hypothetical protein